MFLISGKGVAALSIELLRMLSEYSEKEQEIILTIKDNEVFQCYPLDPIEGEADDFSDWGFTFFISPVPKTIPSWVGGQEMFGVDFEHIISIKPIDEAEGGQ
jgi:hypothetical protein